ncbi:MAG: NAD+ synthase [Candidatus Nanohalobium sp.]
MKPAEITEEAENFVQEKVEEAGAEGLVVGLSGGIDSATALKLAVRSLGSEKVTAPIMPGEPSREDNMEDARELAEELDVEIHEIEIKDAVKAFEGELPFEPGKEGLGNVRARIRMAYLYSFANEENMLVLGTGNRTEYLLGYFTKYGDGATDIAPLLDLYKTEVRELARQIGLDRKFIEKEPTAGLWEGQTDENELGASYEQIDVVLKKLVDMEESVEEIARSEGLEKEKIEDLEEMYRASEHKRQGTKGLNLFDRSV